MESLIDKLTSLSKRRGFIFQNSEIYGGLASTWDYGPIGAELKKNIKDYWWNYHVHMRDDIVALESSILSLNKVWETSGHIQNFSDPLIECKECNARFREDELIVTNGACPNSKCTTTDFEEPREFNMMFKTNIGPIVSDSSEIYLRPETAQGIFVNFENIINTSRKKIPFGVAQIGKAFRNEITTGNFIFRTREFEMMEIEYFVKPDDSEKFYEEWIKNSMNFLLELNINDSNLRIREHEQKDLSHYSKGTSDIEYDFPWGWAELQGIANRGSFDLDAHSESSSKNFSIFEEASKSRYTPHVIEPSIGVDRLLLVTLLDAYTEEKVEGKDEIRTVLKLSPKIAPIKIAILPLSKDQKLSELSKKIQKDLLSKGNLGKIEYDETQSIGRRYRRQDEIGTPLCITIDFDSLEDNSVTVRNRDSMLQERISIESLHSYLLKNINNY
ncbi:glycine--tRNA ligase [Chloroflexi bacterium]|nr:glycine--tRNA ligase [Chloroflexota bacterium]